MLQVFGAIACVACWVFPEMAAAAPDTFFSKQWHLRQIDAPAAWTVSTGSRDVIVALIDTGVDIQHEDLRENIWTNLREIPGDGIDNDQNGYIDDVHGWNFVSQTGDVRPVYREIQTEDAWTHGTLVASLIGARGGNGIGVSGVAWNVRLLPLVILDADGEGDVTELEEAVRYAVSQGADVINFSLVGYEETPTLTELMRRAADAGVVLVAATGNSAGKQGVNIDQVPAYPACSEGASNIVIGVTGTDALDQRAPFANTGITCTDIAAPAHEIFGARPSYPHHKGRATSTVPGYYGGYTGTSLAAPLVSGVAALLKAQHPEWTAAQIRERILTTADPIQGSGDGWRTALLGVGRLNAGRALGASATSALRAQEKPRLIASRTSPVLTIVNPATGSTSTRALYGAAYRGGIQLVPLNDQRTLAWPTRGGGHAMVLDTEGRVQWSGFPVGTKSATWRITRRSDGAIEVRGGGMVRRLRLQHNRLEQL